MNQVKTLVYLDLEATGLASSGRPRITELSLVAVNLRDVLGQGTVPVLSMSQYSVQNCMRESDNFPPVKVEETDSVLWNSSSLE